MNQRTLNTENRVRFSIRSALLATVIAALLLTVVMLYRELLPLRKEVARLRDEVGELHIVDERMPHAIQVETDDALEWKWRVWVPAGLKYRVRADGGSVPAVGFPEDGLTLFVTEPGEQVIRYVIKRDQRSGQWKGEVHAGGGTVGTDQHAWVEWTSRTSMSAGVGSSTKSFERADKIELIRHRVAQANSSSQIPDPAEGFILWLEPY